MKLKSAVFLLILFGIGCSAFGQGAVVAPQIALNTVNGVTRPLPSATITVCAANTGGFPCSPALAGALFKDAALTQPLSNPFPADANGNYNFAIAPGTYTVTVTASGFAGYSYQVSIFTCSPGVCIGTGSNNTFTGINNFNGVTNLNAGGNFSGTFTGNATFNLTGNITDTAGQNSLSLYNLDNIIYVDGIKYTTLASALAACSTNCWIIDNFPETFSSNPFAGFTVPLARIDFGAGTWTVNSQIIVPANVSYFTGSGRVVGGNTVFRAGGGMASNTPLIKALGGQGQVLSRIVVDCNSSTGATGIFATDWNENAGLEKVLVINCPNIGVNVDASAFTVLPAQNYFLRDLEIFPGASGGASTIGLHVKGNGGGGPADVSNVTANGASGHVILASIQAENWNIGTFSRIHGEFATHVWQNTSSSVSGFTIDTISGSPTDTDIVNINGSSTANAFSIRNVSTSGGAINSIVDSPRSITLTDTVLSEYKIGAGALFSQEIYSTSVNLAKHYPTGFSINIGLKSVNYTLLSTDSIVQFTTGTNTITVPHALTGQLWFIRNNQASASITVSCDSGTINGVASVKLQAVTGATVWADGTNCFMSGGSTSTIANGTATLGTAAIASGACATAVTVAAAGIATTDSIAWSFNSDPGAITGYPSLTVFAYPISGNVDFRVCNPSAASVTPGAATLNWSVTR